MNILLFVPAGLLVSMLTRRAAWTVVGLVPFSFVIELAQGFMGSHSCTNADWWANSLGASLGAAVALLAKPHVGHGRLIRVSDRR